MLEVSNADRLVFPEIGCTKGDVVAYYERIAPRLLPYLLERPLSIRRYPKGLAAAGFFQKNVPAHYPSSIARFAVPRSREASKKHKDARAKQSDVTVYPIVSLPEHLPYLANQGAIELHVPVTRASDVLHPDRLIIDLDPPPGALALVRRAALHVRERLASYDLPAIPVATGSKGYHVVVPLQRTVDGETLAITARKFAELEAAAQPELLTTTYRIRERGERVFVDWLRNNPFATGIAPYSLRATPRATVATPLAWDELETTEPGAFSLGDVDRLLERPDPLLQLAAAGADARRFVAEVETAFEEAGLAFETFDRFRS
ncbi:MAG TPA: non-homologous end-joining DNA ligase [Polyangiales bacterium]|nr:non-homologous end-joining DNA ligase [Polyangiales bacterium]